MTVNKDNIIKLDIVQIQGFKNTIDFDESLVGEFALNANPIYENKNETFAVISKFTVLNKEQIVYKKVGYFDYEQTNDVKWNTLRSFLEEKSYRYVVQNTNKYIRIVGRFSSIEDCRYIQMTDNVLMGFTTIVDESYNKDNPKHFQGNNSYVYFLKKIGEIDGEGIYRYSSDMVIFKDKENIDWIAPLDVDVDSVTIDEKDVDMFEINSISAKSTRVSQTKL